MTQVLITVDELVDAMPSDRPPVVLDVRWRLGDDEGFARYKEGHVPGAIHVDLNTELAAPPSPGLGRHPLPTVDDLQAAARRWGIDFGARVVVYDDCGGLSAARAWWLLRWGGIADVRLLDGGLGAWRDAGLRLSKGDTTPRAGNVILTPGGLPTATIDDVAALASAGEGAPVLLDARAGERYRGEIEPVDPRPGRIPGAVSAPTTENLSASGTFRSAEELRSRFTGLGLGEPGDGAGAAAIVYCGSGINAAHQIAALEIAGYPGAVLYPGSYSQWSNDETRPVETS
ncbi:MAG: sulfurtransferase [Gordonia sp. (in: high G+C Gram-positive bacteria)]|uniref:sulfurtransferase n=1 Tax=Gordonia sp. (in: high G+C Gram-positive bacteria) TaxID=84139 RepID=UPI0039E28598